MNSDMNAAVAAVSCACASLRGEISERLLHAAAWRITLRARLINLLLALNQLRGVVLKLAGDHAAQADRLARDYERLLGALERIDRCPVVTTVQADAPIASTALGFAQAMEIADDATASSDGAQEVVAACVVLMNGLQRLAPCGGAQWSAATEEVNRALAASLTGGGDAESSVLGAVASMLEALSAANRALSTLPIGDGRPDMTRRRRLRLGKDGDVLATIQARVTAAVVQDER